MKKKILILFLLLSSNISFLTGSKEANCQTTKSTQKIGWPILLPPSFDAIPQFFFNDKPAELIQLKGEPLYIKTQGTQLLFVTNTDNNLLVGNISKQYYELLSGSSFCAGEMNEQWFYAGANLPADFQKISSNSSNADVLVSVKQR